MKADRNEFFLISFPLLFCAIHFMYSPVEGIYWHPGAVSYTFFYSLGLLFLSITLRFFYSGRGEKKTVLLFLLAPIIGGSNYSTALVISMILMLLIILLLYQKKWARAITCASIEILLIIALLISMTAPGNSLRQSAVGEPSVLRGIILSVIYAGYSMANATTVPVLLCWFLVSPILYALARKSSLTFRFPLLVWGVLFGVYAALGTPCFYALGYSIPERNINLLYFSYYPIVLTGLFYGFGWISQHLKEENVLNLFFDACLENYGKIFLGFCGAFMCACIGLCTVSGGENGGIRLSNVPTGISATVSLLNGEAETFYLEMTERDTFCRGMKDADAEVSALSVYPELLFYSDITEDPLNWQNEVVANYYGNRSIRLRR